LIWVKNDISEALKIWEMGKKICVTYEGDKNEVVEKKISSQEKEIRKSFYKYKRSIWRE